MGNEKPKEQWREWVDQHGVRIHEERAALLGAIEAYRGARAVLEHAQHEYKAALSQEHGGEAAMESLVAMARVVLNARRGLVRACERLEDACSVWNLASARMQRTIATMIKSPCQVFIEYGPVTRIKMGGQYFEM